MRWIALLLIIPLFAGCAEQVTRTSSTSEPNDVNGQVDYIAWPLEEVLFLGNHVPVPQDFAMEEKEVLFKINEKGTHCELPDLDEWRQQVSQAGGTVHEVEAHCSMFVWQGESCGCLTVAKVNATSGEAKISSGLPGNYAKWGMRAYVRAHVTTSELDYHGQVLFAGVSPSNEALGFLDPAKFEPRMEWDVHGTCAGEIVDVDFELQVPQKVASAYVDFGASTPISTTLGTIAGNQIHFETTEEFVEFSAQVELVFANPGIGGGPHCGGFHHEEPLWQAHATLWTQDEVVLEKQNITIHGIFLV